MRDFDIACIIEFGRSEVCGKMGWFLFLALGYITRPLGSLRICNGSILYWLSNLTIAVAVIDPHAHHVITNLINFKIHAGTNIRFYIYQ